MHSHAANGPRFIVGSLISRSHARFLTPEVATAPSATWTGTAPLVSGLAQKLGTIRWLIIVDMSPGAIMVLARCVRGACVCGPRDQYWSLSQPPARHAGSPSPTHSLPPPIHLFILCFNWIFLATDAPTHHHAKTHPPPLPELNHPTIPGFHFRVLWPVKCSKLQAFG